MKKNALLSSLAALFVAAFALPALAQDPATNTERTPSYD